MPVSTTIRAIRAIGRRVIDAVWRLGRATRFFVLALMYSGDSFRRFHLIIKDERVKPPKKHLRIAVGESPAGPFGNLAPPFTRDWVEGPTAILLGQAYVVFFDAYRDRRYEAMRSRDLKT